jgi:uncharacterized Zn-binding protein involved in type VI secretion
MASRLGARRSGKFKPVSTAPSINRTPVGNSTPPLPYPVTEDLSSSVGTVPNVRFNGDPTYVLSQSTQPNCKGDAAGSCKGVKSGAVSGEVKPVKGSSTVRISGKPIVREGDPCTLNAGNCPGIFVTQPAPGASIEGGQPTSSGNPPVTLETPEEEGWWAKASPWVHGALGLASFVPGLGIVTGAADAGIYAAEGDMVEAGLSAASMIPGGKIITTAGKAIKEATTLGKEAGIAAKLVKGGREAEEAATVAKTAKETDAAAKLKQSKDDANQIKQAERKTEAGGQPPRDGVRVKGKEAGPCDHLRQGNGKGPYRGGAHSKTSKPVNDGKDSHHMPAKKVSPLNKEDGPAIQMDPPDHRETLSNGSQGREGAVFRNTIAQMLAQGRWRDAMVNEIRDVRRVARETGDARKYNEAMLEMLEYFKCLKKHNLLE